MTVLDQAVRPPVGNQLSSSSLSSGVKVGVRCCKSLSHCNAETRKNARRELWDNNGGKKRGGTSPIGHNAEGRSGNFDHIAVVLGDVRCLQL